MRTFTIKVNDADQRLDKFLAKAVPLLPKGLLHKYLRKKRIKVNGKRAEAGYRLKTGDELTLYINDEFFEDRNKQSFLSATAAIDVVYEDDHIMLVNKPQGLVVHEDHENSVDTLINRVLHVLYERGAYDPEKEQSFVPALANRIDRNTCGIVMVAKTAAALRILNEKIKAREIEKRYLCLTVGAPPEIQDTVTHYHKKDAVHNLVTVYDKPSALTKTMTTEYHVLEQRDGISLVEVNLKTGRTHQIRAHLAHLGAPVLGDGKYGRGEVNRAYGVRHQALCACQVAFQFRGDAGVLEYLRGKSFSLEQVWFVEEFRDGRLTKRND